VPAFLLSKLDASYIWIKLVIEPTRACSKPKRKKEFQSKFYFIWSINLLAFLNFVKHSCSKNKNTLDTARQQKIAMAIKLFSQKLGFSNAPFS